MTTSLLVVAHGSRDPRSAATVHAVADHVRTLRPGQPVAAAFLDLSRPTVAEAAAGLGDAGTTRLVVVPLLLTEAFHARVDVPAAVAQVRASHPDLRVALAPVLGLDAGWLDVLDDRLAEAGRGGPAPDALVLAAAGSSDEHANAAVRDLARRWEDRTGLPVVAAFASAASPTPADAVRRLRGDGHRRVAVGSLFLAPGVLPDRVRDQARLAGAAAVGEPFGADPRVAVRVLARARAAVEEVAA